MKIIDKLAGAVIATALLSTPHLCSAQTTSGSMTLGQTSVAYADGPVWLITLVKTKFGMTEDYLKGLEKAIMGVIDEAKKQNMVSDFKILIGDAATTQDFNIMVMVQSKDMANFNQARIRFDRISHDIQGLEIREIMGN